MVGFDWVLNTPLIFNPFCAHVSIYFKACHCVKRVRVQSFSGPYFPAFGLNTERYSISLGIQSEFVKIWTGKTPSTDTFHAVLLSDGNIYMKWAKTVLSVGGVKVKVSFRD